MEIHTCALGESVSTLDSHTKIDRRPKKRARVGAKTMLGYSNEEAVASDASTVISEDCIYKHICGPVTYRGLNSPIVPTASGLSVQIRNLLSELNPIPQAMTAENLALHQALLSNNVSQNDIFKIVELHLRYHIQQRQEAHRQQQPRQQEQDQLQQQKLMQSQPSIKQSSDIFSAPNVTLCGVDTVSSLGHGRDLAIDACMMQDRSTFDEYPFDPLLPCCPPIDTPYATTKRKIDVAYAASYIRK